MHEFLKFIYQIYPFMKFQYDIYHCWMHSEKLLMMDRGTVWKM